MSTRIQDEDGRRPLGMENVLMFMNNLGDDW
jgi:hypothetical protein